MATQIYKKQKTDNDKKKQWSDLLKQLICPLTLALPVDPVVSEFGHTYERKALQHAIEASIDSNAVAVCPITKQQFKHVLKYYPSVNTKSTIERIIQTIQDQDDEEQDEETKQLIGEYHDSCTFQQEYNNARLNADFESCIWCINNGSLSSHEISMLIADVIEATDPKHWYDYDSKKQADISELITILSEENRLDPENTIPLRELFFQSFGDNNNTTDEEENNKLFLNGTLFGDIKCLKKLAKKKIKFTPTALKIFLYAYDNNLFEDAGINSDDIVVVL